MSLLGPQHPLAAVKRSRFQTDVMGMRKSDRRRKNPGHRARMTVRQPVDLDDLSQERVYAIMRNIAKDANGLEQVVLSAGERKSLSGQLFDQAPGLVMIVAEAMERKRALFPDVPLCGQKLMARQGRALALSGLSALLHELSIFVDDLALLEQATAVHDAMSVVRQVRSDADRPFGPAQATDRQLALAEAERLLAARQVHKVRVAKRRKDQKMKRP